MARPSKFGDEFKRDAVRLVRTTGRTYADVARELGMNRETLRTWVREAETETEDSEAGTGLAKAERDELARLCRVLDVGRSAFYAWRKREPARQVRAVEDARIVAKIRAFHADSEATNGSPRIAADLRDAEEIVNVKRVARLMRQAGIVGLHLRKDRRTTIPGQSAAPVPDLLGRDFSPGAVDERWCGNITYLPVGDSWLYLATVIDIGSRRLIGWSIADHLRTELISDALTVAVRARGGRTTGVIFHADRGCQGSTPRPPSPRCVPPTASADRAEGPAPAWTTRSPRPSTPSSNGTAARQGQTPLG